MNITNLFICVLIWVSLSYLISYSENRYQNPFSKSDIKSKLIFLIFNDWRAPSFNYDRLDRSVYCDYEKSDNQYLYVKSLHNNKILKFNNDQLLKVVKHLSKKYITSRLKVFYYQHSYSPGSIGFNIRYSLSAEQKLDRIFYEEREYIIETFPELFQIINK